MALPRSASVTTSDGRHGTLEPGPEHANGDTHRVVRLDDGQELIVPEGLLAEREDGTYYLPVDLRQVQGRTTGSGSGLIVVPVLAEEIDVQTRRAVTGRVRIGKQVGRRQRAWI